GDRRPGQPPLARAAALVALRRRRPRPRLRRLARLGALPGVDAEHLILDTPAEGRDPHHRAPSGLFRPSAGVTSVQSSLSSSSSSVSGAGGCGSETAPGGGASGSGPVDGGRFGSETAPAGGAAGAGDGPVGGAHGLSGP